MYDIVLLCRLENSQEVDLFLQQSEGGIVSQTDFVPINTTSYDPSSKYTLPKTNGLILLEKLFRQYSKIFGILESFGVVLQV